MREVKGREGEKRKRGRNPSPIHISGYATGMSQVMVESVTSLVTLTTEDVYQTLCRSLSVRVCAGVPCVMTDVAAL